MKSAHMHSMKPYVSIDLNRSISLKFEKINALLSTRMHTYRGCYHKINKDRSIYAIVMDKENKSYETRR